MNRREGWEGRLNDVIEAARDKPYEIGQHDCLRVACASVEALIGVDYWPVFSGYESKREARMVILEHGKNLAEAVTKTLGIDSVEPPLARRGDIVLYRDDEEHLGVCVGPWVAVLGAQGLQLVTLTDAGVRCCWRIG